LRHRRRAQCLSAEPIEEIRRHRAPP
jgi:hypothetical protein